MDNVTMDNLTAQPDIVHTIYGRFLRASKKRLDLTYDYEHAQILSLHRAAHIISPQIFFDVGANIGVYSVFLSQIPSLEKMYAFEPSPQTFALLRDNLEEQHDPRFVYFNEALSDADANLPFSLYGDLAGNNAIPHTNFSTTKPDDTITVPARAMDQLISTSGYTFICKIDVEGHELEVVKGGQSFLSTNTGLLQIESFHNHIAELATMLKSIGYRKLFRMKDDYFFTNIDNRHTITQITDAFFEEVSDALQALQNERRRRRTAIRATRQAFNTVKFGGDPIIL